MSTETPNPCIVLVEPQMGENIGGTARAMLNCGLDDLRLVNPRDGWPNERALTMSSGALDKMPPVKVFKSLPEAIADCNYVLATTARIRELEKPVVNAKEAGEETRHRSASGQKTAFLFGPERTGLNNDDLAIANAAITIPLNPDFCSLNLSQAVLLIAYEWLQTAPPEVIKEMTEPAPHEKFNELVERFETTLEENHFFRTDEHKPYMIRNLRTLLTRAEMNEQEIRTFHGVISALTGKKGPKNGTEDA